MKYETYDLIWRLDDGRQFGFKSMAPKGEFDISVEFAESSDPNVYYLAFGNLQPDGSIDDYIKNSNHDRDKILATVAAAVYEFTTLYPQKFIIFSGSTPSRTRLYRMAITVNLEELNKDFDIFGLQLNGLKLSMEKFQKNCDYTGYAVKRKTITLAI